jgi:hypothetical protein
MRKSVTFISAFLTAFVLAMLAGVAYAYNQGFTASSLFSQSTAKISPSATANLLATASVSSEPTQAPTQSQAPQVGPRDAAAMAAKFLNQFDLYSVELATYNGAQVYKVTFVSGNVAYVSMSGQVSGVVLVTPTAPPPVVIVNSNSGGSNNHHESSGGGHSEGGEGGD